jgi:hypothetical protein
MFPSPRALVFPLFSVALQFGFRRVGCSSRRQDFWKVKPRHADPVVCHPVINVEAVWRAEVVATVDAGWQHHVAHRILKESGLSEEEIDALRKAFIPGLVSANESGSYSRRRAFLDELPPEFHELLGRFVEARLLVRDVDKRGRTTLEVAHEALLRTWPALTTWLIEDRDKLRQHNAIVRAAKEWDESGRKTDLLVHRDGRLKDAAQLISERRFAFVRESVEHTYFAACVTDQEAREAAEQEERDRRVKEAEDRGREQKEAAGRLRRLAVVLAVVALAAVGGAIFGFWHRKTFKELPDPEESVTQKNK